jgi:hypothetical protein
MLLALTTDKIQIVTTAAADLDVIVEYADVEVSTKLVSVGKQLTKIPSAATTDICGAPASGFMRRIKRVFVFNVHGSNSNGVTVIYNANATTYRDGGPWTVLAGESVRYTELRGWEPLDTAGRVKVPGISSLPSGNANVADVVANAADTYLTGASLLVGGRLQAGSFFKWRLRATKTAAGTAAPIFNIRVGTAGAVGDTVRATVTAAAQTAAADTGFMEIDGIFRTVGATATIQMILRFAHAGTTTGFFNGTQEQMLANLGSSFDVTNLQNVIGLSVNPGTAGVWTFQEVTCDANNLLAA